MDSKVLPRIVTGIAIAAVVVAALLFLAFIIVDLSQSYWTTIIREHFRAVVGLPMAAVAAFIVVALFRQREGPFEIEGPGFKLKGATGPVLLWVLCFWVIAWAIKETW
jgi:hypothetical protein